MSVKRPTPLRLRPTVGYAMGTTAFFRNRVLNETLLNELLISGRKHYSILFHACSIGAEVYSFLIQYLAGGFNEHFSLSCYATDKQQDFVTYADHAQFPQEILQGCTEVERQYFTVHDGAVSLESSVKKTLNFCQQLTLPTSIVSAVTMWWCY
jgi:chemotaxis methyl-accepting protein methylase